MSVVLDKSQIETFDEDVVFVERFLSGDEVAFERLYEKYYDRVLAIAKGILLNTDEATDTLQEIFTLVYRHLGRFDKRSRFSTWLFRVAVNRSIQEARKHKNRWRIVELREAATTAAPEITGDNDPKVQNALAKLQPGDRALLTLFYWQELSLQDIAASLSCSTNAAKTRLYRARERFRALYERDAE